MGQPIIEARVILSYLSDKLQSINQPIAKVHPLASTGPLRVGRPLLGPHRELPKVSRMSRQMALAATVLLPVRSAVCCCARVVPVFLTWPNAAGERAPSAREGAPAGISLPRPAAVLGSYLDATRKLPP